jgi:hypothetical protein
MANLDTLPVEITQEILSSADLYRDKDSLNLLDVRLVNHSLYIKTLYLFLKRVLAEDMAFKLDTTDLAILLRLSTIPMMRDRLRHVTLRGPPRPCTNHDVSHDFNGLKYRPIEIEMALQDEIISQEHINSPEMYHLLRAIFPQLKSATRLETITVDSVAGAVIEAVQDCDLPHQTFVLEFQPREVSMHYPGKDWKTLLESTLIGRRIRIAAPPHKCGRRWKSGHYRNSYFSSASLSTLLEATSHAEELELLGCTETWHFPLKLCHGCADIFDNNIYYVPYPNLCSLSLEYLYIDGFYLNGFLKRHMGTLKHVTLNEVSLTRGSWKHIFRTMRLGRIHDLKLYHLRQKPNGPPRRSYEVYRSYWQGVQVTERGLDYYLDLLTQNETYDSQSKYKDICLPDAVEAAIWYPPRAWC